MTTQTVTHRIRPALRLLPLALAVFFAGCANLAPDYQTPALTPYGQKT